jgi:hypothetical protein
MIIRTLIVLLQLIIIPAAFSQSAIRKLPAIINHPSLNVLAPYISADGNALLFVSDSGQDGALIVSYTSREPDWTTPVELPKHLSNRLNFLKGYALSGDGKKIYVTSAKSPVVGGYDIMMSELKGNTWTPPVNLMLPINSKTNDASPSFTPDGSTIFFMRCDRMDQTKAEGCKIFTSTKKSNGQWGEPVELPAAVNSGNSQTPRILPDGQTLIFASDKIQPNKGGMDLYQSRMDNGSWSTPVPLAFVNTERDDQFVSVTAFGRYLLKEAKGTRNNYEITEFLFPKELRPKALTKVEGKISGPDGEVVSCYISVTDLQTKKKVYSGRPDIDGSYFLYLPEGTQYELSVDPEQSNVTYFSKLFDLRSEKIPQKEKVNILLKTPVSGDEIPLELVTFRPFTSELDPIAQEELKRFSRLIKSSPGVIFEVQITLSGLVQDSLQSSQDLTEIKVDSVTVPADTAMQLLEHKIAKITYHNDRTLKQAEAINQFLNREGVKPDQIAYVVNAVPTSETPRLVVRAMVR